MANENLEGYELVSAEELALKSGFSIGEEEEPEEENTEETLDAVDDKSAEEKPKEAAPKEDEQLKIYNQAQARARVVEKEKKALKKQNEELAREIREIKALLSKKQEEPEEDLPNLTDDPLGRLDHRLDDLQEQLKAKEAQEALVAKQREEIENVGLVLQVADQHIVQRSTQLPQYKESMEFLVRRLAERAFELDEVEDYDDAMKQVAIWVNEAKIDSLSRGINPGDRFYGMARYFGWSPSQVAVAKKEEKENAKEVIKKEREKESQTRTISAVPGGPAKTKLPFSPANIGKMPAEELQAHLREQKRLGGKKGWKNDPATRAVGIEA